MAFYIGNGNYSTLNMIMLSYVEWNGNTNLTFMIKHLRSWIDFENEDIPWFNGLEHVEHLHRKPVFSFYQ